MIGGRWLRMLASRLIAAVCVGALLLALAGGCGSEGAPQKPPVNQPPAKTGQEPKPPDQKPPPKAPSQDNQQPGGT